MFVILADDSSNLAAYNGEDIQSATFALQQAQISYSER